ncbi:hypothetical protein QR685DRAFT_175874 [Neurospora intermedia]|uniref:Secreted protein n=1 Tax=Neurospora intermedia TaxID=5142 RepID=A0ABR3DLC5_NEUIN
MPLRLPFLICKQTLITSFCAILCGSVQNVSLAPLNMCRYRRDERVKVTKGRCSRCRPLPPSFFCHYFFPPAKLLKITPSLAPSTPAVHHHRQSRSLPFLGCRLFFGESSCLSPRGGFWIAFPFLPASILTPTLALSFSWKVFLF